MKRTQLVSLTALALLAFAGNSLLCRLALKQTQIDAATFTLVRIFCGAAVLWLAIRIRETFVTKTPHKLGSDGANWFSALALFVYAAAFSFAYQTLPVGTGALLLFGAVQATMIFWGLRLGERLHAWQLAGLTLALSGLVLLVFPGLSAPPFRGSSLMLCAGVAWGIYSLRGKRSGDPARATAGNFIRALPLAALVSVIALPWARFDRAGIIYAALSGALASGIGYVIWYSALPHLPAARAATVQLSVPVIAAAGGILLLGEPLTVRFLIAACAVLGGIALVVASSQPRRS